jgi:crotonobetainyl-CoA:carnitine CoA-transferase CaiB-like acyl-CoA transferase
MTAGHDIDTIMSEPPLAGVTILDLSRVLSGPYCTMLAADMGARVIKIEHPDRGDDTRAWGPPFVKGESAYYLSVNRNKESVAVDFKSDAGRAIIDALLARADVLVENFRPGTLDRLGLGYADVSARDPRLIYVSISGFGQTGPRRMEAGYDAVAQGEGGLMSVTGTPEGPPVRLGVAIADIAAGMFAFQGMLLALVARGRTGRGQWVDVSLLDSVAALLSFQGQRYLAAGEVASRTGNRHASIAPYDTFDAADGVLVLAVGNDSQWQKLCATLGLSGAAKDPRFLTNAGRVSAYEALKALLSATLKSWPLEPLVGQLRAAGIPCGAVRSVDEALRDPQILAREMVTTVAHPTIGALSVLGIPTKLSATPGAIRRPPPRLGEQTRDVLSRELGMTEAQIAELVAAGVIR